MPLTPGLVPTLRLDQDEQQPTAAPDIMVDVDEDPTGPQQEIDERGNILSISYPDGSIDISLDGKPLGTTKEAKDNEDWFRNLVDDLDDGELGRVVDDLLRGIEHDISSRQKWIEDCAQGLKLLGLSIELPNVSAGSTDGAPVEGMSRIRHPLLLEAVLRFQANARSELLPTDGPVKIRNDTGDPDLTSDQLSTALERDMNHYLTSTATEYYPDTDRMLLLLGFRGTSFKKVHFCPLRNRPVSETVDANDLIVNDAATDLNNAIRVTQRVSLKASTVKRLQILGVYRDIALHTPDAPKIDSVKEEKDNIQGVNPDGGDPEDRNREIYECYCELDLKGFEHTKKGKVTGLQVPYRVTIDISSREILSIVRNYDEDTKDLPEARQCFVKYTFVPGLGFYDIGLLHILGNTTNAVTAAWREMLDAGMFANFPGFLFLDSGGRQNTNIFRVPPGGGAPVKSSAAAIRDAIMPLPYKEPGPSMMGLVENIAETGQRIGGTAELPVGEGKMDAPVGTTIALIDQATKVLNSVHKRMHAAQAREFQLLAECFREHPESFWQRNKKPATKWDEETFLRALDCTELVPQADPNTASQTQRMLKVAALQQAAAAASTLFDQLKVATVSLQAIGWSNPQQFFVPLSAMGRLPPEVQAKQQETDTKAKLGAAKSALDMAKAQEISSKIGQPENGNQPQEQPDPAALLQAKSKLMDSQTWKQELADKRHEAAMNTAVKYAEIHSKEQLERLGMQKDHLSDQMDLRKEELHLDAARIEADRSPEGDK